MIDDKENIIEIVVIDKSGSELAQHDRKDSPNYFDKLFKDSLRESLMEEILQRKNLLNEKPC